MKICSACTYIDENPGLSCQICETVFYPDSIMVNEDEDNTNYGQSVPKEHQEQEYEIPQKACGTYYDWLNKIDFIQLEGVPEEHFDNLFLKIPQRIFSTLRKQPFSLTATRCSLFSYYIAQKKTKEEADIRAKERDIIREQNESYLESMLQDVKYQNRIDTDSIQTKVPIQTSVQIQTNVPIQNDPLNLDLQSDNQALSYSASIIQKNSEVLASTPVQGNTEVQISSNKVQDLDYIRNQRADAFEKLFNKKQNEKK